MARPIILSNGEMAVGMNPNGLVHDFYYPYVGLESHTSQRITNHKVGLFTDGTIHWLDDGNWQVDQHYLPGSMIGWTAATNENIGFQITFQDFVDSELNVFVRNIHVINLSDRPRAAKLYMHQAFVIKEAVDGHDTAQYLPEMKDSKSAILHYKGKRAFLVSGQNLQTGESFDSFSIGSFGDFADGKRDGSWRDAEDGELSRNPVERVQTDSVLEFSLNFEAHDSVRVHYYLAAGKSMNEAKRLLNKVRKDTTLERLLKTSQYWKKWLSPAKQLAEVRIAPQYRQSFLSSLLTMKSMMDRRGAVMASLDTEMLNYTKDAYVNCWPRDASYIFWAFLRLGYMDEVRQFFRFAADILDEDGFFYQMYCPDASMGPNSHAWMLDGEITPPIQSDETATTLFLFAKAVQHSLRHGDKLESWRELYERLARPMANFLSEFIDPATKLPRASYELWEVRFSTTTYTAAATFGALNAAADIAELFHETDNVVKWRAVATDIYENRDTFWNSERNFFHKGFRRTEDGNMNFDDTIDLSSFYGAWAFGLFDDEKLSTAFDTFTERFYIRDNNVGAPRFEDDDYNGHENPWFITSFWLAQYQMSKSNKELAKKVLDWADGQIERTNILPEQLNPTNGDMLSAAPLGWSHAEFINTCLDFGNPYNDPFKR